MNSVVLLNAIIVVRSITRNVLNIMGGSVGAPAVSLGMHENGRRLTGKALGTHER